MTMKLLSAAVTAAILFLGTAGAQGLDPDPAGSWGGKSLRGLTTVHLEFVDSKEAAAAKKEEAESPLDDPGAFLRGLLESAKQEATAPPAEPLKAETVEALKKRTRIKLHEGTLEEAQAAGLPQLVIKVERRDRAGQSNDPHDVTLELRQQVQLARDPSFRFYATTFRSAGSDLSGQTAAGTTLRAQVNRFVELWQVAN